MKKPCESSCSKCGSNNIHIRFFIKGQDTNGLCPNRKDPSTEWANREDAYFQPALKDCIVHKCRTCGYSWDSDPLKEVER